MDPESEKLKWAATTITLFYDRSSVSASNKFSFELVNIPAEKLADGAINKMFSIRG